jgi:hypothetical protein
MTLSSSSVKDHTGLVGPTNLLPHTDYDALSLVSPYAGRASCPFTACDVCGLVNTGIIPAVAGFRLRQDSSKKVLSPAGIEHLAVTRLQ